MTQKEDQFSSNLSHLMSPDIAKIGRQNFEMLAAVQKEFLDVLSKANREWLASINEEATLTSNFTRKATTAKSIPEAAAAFQEWTSQEIELSSRRAKQIMEATQDFTRACTKIIGNGRGLGST